MAEPENLVLALLRDMRADMAAKGDITRIESKIADLSSEIADVRSDVGSLRADVASDMLSLEKRLSGQIIGLRRAVVEYHSSTIGHGVLISEFEERLRRVEQHQNLPPGGSH